MSKEQLKMWWEDRDKIEDLAIYLARTQRLTTADDMVNLFRKPEAFQKEYMEMMQSKTNALHVKRPQTEQFWDERFYPINGDFYESITTILWAYPSPWLTTFVGNVGNVEAEIRKTIGGERGSKVHDALQQNNVQPRENYTDDEWLCLIHAKQFHEEYKPELILNEQWCWSVKKHYAGRFDRIVSISGKTTLIDWKTGYVGREAWLQLAAEKCAIEEKMGIIIESWGIVALNNRTTAGWKYYPIEERTDVKAMMKEGHETEAVQNVFENDIEVFDNLHEVWKDCFRSVKPKRYPVFPVPKELDLSIPIFEAVDDGHDDSAVDALKNVPAGVKVAGTEENVDLFNDQGKGGEIVRAGNGGEAGTINTLDKLLDELGKLFTMDDLSKWYMDKQPEIQKLTTAQMKEFSEVFKQAAKVNQHKAPAEEKKPRKKK